MCNSAPEETAILDLHIMWEIDATACRIFFHRMEQLDRVFALSCRRQRPASNVDGVGASANEEDAGDDEDGAEQALGREGLAEEQDGEGEGHERAELCERKHARDEVAL